MNEEQNIQVSITRIWQVLSHVRGVMPDMELQQFAIAMTFLRRIDCLIGKYAQESASFYSNNSKRLSNERLAEKLCEISGGFPFYNHSGYTFNGILNANNSVEVVMNSYLQGFSENVLEFLDGMNFNQNLAFMQRQSRYLVDMINLYTEIDLSSSAIDNEEFIHIITLLLGNEGKGSLEFYTPIELSDLIAECLLSDDIRGEKNNFATIYDPVCGAGSMLAIAGEKAKQLAVHQDNISLYGQEINMYCCSIAKAIALLAGNEYSQIHYGNTLTDDMLPDDKFQYIIAHFPFGLSWSAFRKSIEQESLYPSDRFYLGHPSTHDSQFLFIEHILSKMDYNGSRAAFITTGSVLNSGSANSGESRIRRWLFERDMVETIIALPQGVLLGTSIPVYLWIITNKKKESRRGRVRLINASAIAEKKSRYPLDDKSIKKIVEEYKSDIVSTMSVYVENEQFGFYEVGLLENDKKKETVSISLDTDIQDFIKKERQPFAKGEITVDYNSVEKGYSVQFGKFFKQEETPIASLKEEANNVMSVIDAISLLKPKMEQILANDEDITISDSWRELSLRSIAKIVTGSGKPTTQDAEGLPLLSVPYLRGKSDNECTYAVTPRTKYSTDEDVILVVKGANSGEVFSGVNGILSTSLAAIKCTNNSLIIPQYLYYLIKGNEKKIMGMAVGAVIKSLNAQSIMDLKCKIPTIGEQRKIVKYLDSVIAIIDVNLKALKSDNNTLAEFRQVLIENVIGGKYPIG